MRSSRVFGVVAVAACMPFSPDTYDSNLPTVPVSGTSDPTECVDPGPLETRFVRARKVALVKEALAEMGECSRTLTEPGRIRLSVPFDLSGASAGVYVVDSTLSDCHVAECIKDVFTRRKAAPGLANTYDISLEVRPGKPPIHELDVKWPKEKQGLHCQDTAIQGLKAPEIQSFVRGKHELLQKCLGPTIESNRSPNGLLAIGFTIELDGHVSNVYVNSNEVRDCRIPR